MLFYLSSLNMCVYVIFQTRKDWTTEDNMIRKGSGSGSFRLVDDPYSDIFGEDVPDEDKH